MYAIVKAEKGSYDSNIKMVTVDKYMKKPLANEGLIDLLVDEILLYANDYDLDKYINKYGAQEELHKEIKEDIVNNVIANKESFISLSEVTICLSYNKIKALNSFTIPCSSLHEYAGKTVSIISFQ